MRFVILVIILTLLALLFYILKTVVAQQRAAQMRKAQWRRHEFVDSDGRTHVVLRRAVWLGAKEVLADPDQEVAIIDDADPEHNHLLAEARLEADLRVSQTNYRHPH